MSEETDDLRARIIANREKRRTAHETLRVSITEGVTLRQEAMKASAERLREVAGRLSDAQAAVALSRP